MSVPVDISSSHNNSIPKPCSEGKAWCIYEALTAASAPKVEAGATAELQQLRIRVMWFFVGCVFFFSFVC